MKTLLIILVGLCVAMPRAAVAGDSVSPHQTEAEAVATVAPQMHFSYGPEAFSGEDMERYAQLQAKAEAGHLLETEAADDTTEELLLILLLVGAVAVAAAAAAAPAA